MSVTCYQNFHQKNLGVLISPYLSKEDRESLGQADKAWRKTKVGLEAQDYLILKDKIKSKKAIYISEGKGLHQELLLGILGAGGSKKAIELQGGRALIVPNMDTANCSVLVTRWKRMVHEEIVMSKLLTKIGLLSPLSQRVRISLSIDSPERTIPAYLSETFEKLGKTKGWFIIDRKNFASSTWKQGENYLFKTEEERLNEKNWDSVVNSVLSDVVKICEHNIPAGGDSLNLAIVNKPSESAVCQYEIRYFGFDFSSKNEYLSMLQIQNKPPHATWLFERILDLVFYYEFGERYDDGDESGKLRGLKDQLVQKYSKNIISRLS